MVAGDPHRPLTSPSLRYLVHLTAPGWDVVGATAPWLPGVALGHNAQVAWSMAASNADTQDLYVERLNPANERQVQDAGRWVDMQVEHDAIAVKGRREPFEYDRLYTRHGVVVGIDRERHLAFTLRWSGSEPGAAGELAAVALDRAQSASDFRRALARWKMPVVDVVFADRGGVVGQEVAGLVPRRAPGAGFVPAAGWNRSAEWSGWAGSIARPSGAGTRPAFVVSANDSLARTSRIREQLAAAGQQPSALRVDVDAMKRLQHDVHAWNADRLVPMLQLVRGRSDRAEVLRSAILAWNREMDAASNAATMYASWEAALRRLLLAQRVPADLRVELSPRLGSIASTVGIPTRTWFDGDVAEARDALLIDALEAAVEEGGGRADTLAWGVAHTATFTHTLAVEERSRLRFNVGPFPAPGYADTVFAATQTAGPALQLIFDVGDWDRSVAASAPGQSEWPDSPHFADLAKAWAAAEYVPLPFTEPAVRSAAASTLTLRPTQP
jgi:penicillin amidase